MYAVYGYMPQKGTQITSSYTNVSSLASNRVLFSAPIGFTGANFTYYAINKYGMSTSAGIVYITVDGSAVSSPFTTSNENWFVVYDATASAGWSATSIGQRLQSLGAGRRPIHVPIGNLNHFIYSDSIPYVVGSANTARWSFTAPSKFRYGDAHICPDGPTRTPTRDHSGNFERAYNGYISFWLTSFAGDFTTSVYPNPKTFVALTCATCASGAGITLAQRNITWVGDTRLFNFTLNEQPINGWKKDPKSVFLVGLTNGACRKRPPVADGWCRSRGQRRRTVISSTCCQGCRRSPSTRTSQRARNPSASMTSASSLGKVSRRARMCRFPFRLTAWARS